MMKNTLLFMYTESSVHAGTGSGLSAIDLPIQRERSTEYPIIQGSGVKGALRSQANGDKDTINAIFGPAADEQRASEHAGALSVGEARIVLFPVRSLMGVFAYVTSPMALARLGRDIGIPEEFAFSVKPDSCLVSGNEVVANGKVVLEEFSFTAQSDSRTKELAQWLAEKTFPANYTYWQDKLTKSLVILPEDAFRDFVKNSTEVTTHIQLDKNKKTVIDGALWTQEALPSDCLLYSNVTAHKVRLPVTVKRNGNEVTIPLPDSLGNGTPEEVLEWTASNLLHRIQIGGDETTGQGCVALRWLSK